MTRAAERSRPRRAKSRPVATISRQVIVRAHDLVRKVCNFSGSCGAARGSAIWQRGGAHPTCQRGGRRSAPRGCFAWPATEDRAMNYLRTTILLAGLTALFMGVGHLIRSEERRVGKECRCRWSWRRYKKTEK